jgi:DNA-binding transcriptional regulator GbsR (MarR family)
METTDLIIKTLAASAEPMKAGEIAEATNLDKKAVDKAMKVLKDEGRIVSPKRCYWTAS